VEAIFTTILLTGLILGLAYAVAATFLLFNESYKAKKKPLVPKNFPAVSVFKPLKGLDSSLEENLRSFFEQDYPTYEIIFGVSSHSDPAVEIVERLKKEYPRISASLIINPRMIGENPKVNNLCNMYPHARYDVLVISDSNVRVRPFYLQDLVGNLEQPRVGLVTSAIRGVGSSSRGGVLENLHLNSFIASNVYGVTKIFGIPVTIGKSMCFRRETLEKLGGFRAYASYLIEDALIGKHIKEDGLKIRQSIYYVDNVNEGWSLRNFLSRHVRWSVLRRHLKLIYYLAEVLAHPVAMSLLYFLWVREPYALAVFVGTCGVKILVDRIAATFVDSQLQWYYYLLIPVKDLIMAAIWISTFFRSTVVWRGNRFVVLKGTAVLPASMNSLPVSWARKIWDYKTIGARTTGYLSKTIARMF
jgi:ceramide glucosyltransferase